MKTIKNQAVFDVFNQYFMHVKDPRQQHKVIHLLGEVLFYHGLAVIAGADDFNEIAGYANEKQSWLRTFLQLPGGIPSHDTFNRVLCMIDPRQFSSCFIEWMDDIRNALPALPGNDDVICLDGKTVCNSRIKKPTTRKPSIWSALWQPNTDWCWDKRKCYEKSNEITAIPALLKLLLVKGSIITIDAMGCQKKIAKTIRGKQADYILAVKGNQGNLYKRDYRSVCKGQRNRPLPPTSIKGIIQLDKDHGRIENRDVQPLKTWIGFLKFISGRMSKASVKLHPHCFSWRKRNGRRTLLYSSLPGNAGPDQQGCPQTLAH
jgi:hypothetical protein